MVLLYVSFTMTDYDSWSKSRRGRICKSFSRYAYGFDAVTPWYIHNWVY